MTYNFLDQKTVLRNAKVKLGSISSSVWLEMILIRALPIVYSALRAANRREGQSNLTNYLKSSRNGLIGLGVVNSWIC